MNIQNQILQIKKELNSLTETYDSSVELMIENIKILSGLVTEFEKNWAGRWGERTYNFYMNFIKSGRDVQIVLTDNDIYSYIEKKTDIILDQIKDETGKIVKQYVELQEKTVTELSVIKTTDNLSAEASLLDNLEEHTWGVSPLDYIKMRRPKTLFTYNPAEVLSKGLSTPPHISVGADLMTIISMLDAVQTFQKNLKRLIRQLELKLSIEEYSENSSDFIVKVLEKFHVVARQLLNRHSGRSTIEITDEYDVQDLLHSLLRIEFEDVRAEEYTPSYAGSSTRMDFLLKKEKIVIEAKKTRDGLKDKEIGEQLILDAQHYKAHPDCNKLICFVYDPDSKVKNPRGLENDLNSLSSEKMTVEVYIRP